MRFAESWCKLGQSDQWCGVVGKAGGGDPNSGRFLQPRVVEECVNVYECMSRAHYPKYFVLFFPTFFYLALFAPTIDG